MGTNYYVEKKSCDYCGRGGEDYHIGKSSGGWCFSLHVDPDEGINNLDDVIELATADGSVIVDEYRRIHTVDELRDVILNRSWGERSDYAGYENEAEFHRLNESQPGPNNLCRCKIDGDHCVGHGSGTYDFITGTFC